VERILLVSLSSSPGMTHYTYLLANHMSDNHDVTLLAAHIMDLSQVTERVGVLTARTDSPYLTMQNGNLIEIARIVRRIRALKPDLVHFLSPHPWNIPLSLACIRWSRVVHSLHDPLPHTGEMHRSLIVFFNKHLLSRLTHQVVLHGNVYYQQVRSWLGSIPIHVIPLLNRSARNPKPMPDKPTFLFFGRIEPYKGLDVLLSAAEIMDKDGIEFELVVAGAGSLKPYQSQLARLRHVTVMNYRIEEDQVNRLFEESRFVVMPYTDATQSGIIPISYSNMRPVIVTNVGSLPEYVVHEFTGLIIEPHDPSSLALALKRLLTDLRLTERMALQALDYFRNNLDSTVIASRFLQEVYGISAKEGVRHDN